MDFSPGTLLPSHPKTAQGQIQVLKGYVSDRYNKSTQAKLTIRPPKISAPVHQENRINNPIVHELAKRSRFLRTLYRL